MLSHCRTASLARVFLWPLAPPLWPARMIALTRLNGHGVVVNASLIRCVESRPDTYVTLTDGERIIVRDSVEQVVRKTIEFQRTVRLLPDAA